MSPDSIILDGDRIPGRGRSVNPFVIVPDAAGFIGFAEEVFDAVEVREARTPTPDGTLIHAEVRIGDALLLLADQQDGWHSRPGLFQVWVAEAPCLIRRAVARGARLVTPPTPFYGSLTLARVADPWGNLWWLYQPQPGQPDPTPAWSGGSDTVFRALDAYLRSTS